MTSMNTDFVLDWLAGLDESEQQQIVSDLNTHGRISDHSGTGLSSTIVEAWKDHHTDYLRERGYKGGDLVVTTHTTQDGTEYILQTQP
ncbi:MULTISPECIES: hypothetical protein [unclassified Pseudomonas]|uniref:hypothetical protein n=1 Tax=unclassified Pseudomonas TaxID=196821 RepID=UPI000C8842B2|nr:MULTISPECIES: hypothetical protein [unclassified Pseudomonas]PMZ92479.1 hypothetical protein C1X79_19505 [Pseudomonas sp. FW305-42]PNA20726.1 hypothetical protein C1X78_21325 [Pseudomonas sp. MPR-R1B]PNB22071.1 hypothetical protein C1X80_20965 [Pseudomonas sp. DP16D-E2]PNB41306.1 hypothetical protein C1X75_21250 [Pseudomonas sp. FW305-17]PNB56888.1 hypothetical protein C1X77_22385 [Pseudomonas sp. GW531-E2]